MYFLNRHFCINQGLVLLEKDSNLAANVSTLKEVEETIFSMLEPFLLSIPEPKARSRPGPWSLVSKAMRPKRIACEGLEANSNEMEKMNYVLIVLTSKKLSKQTSAEQLQTLLKHLEALELRIHGLEDGLERMFRHY